jgi:hypothetical protein
MDPSMTYRVVTLESPFPKYMDTTPSEYKSQIAQQIAQARARLAVGGVTANSDSPKKEESDGNRTTRLAAAGGIKSIVDIMRTKPEDSELQLEACMSLSDQLENPSTHIVFNKNFSEAGEADVTVTIGKFMSLGALECVVTAMQSHAQVSELQHWACRVLKVLACKGKGLEIGAAGGIERIVEAIRSHQNDIDLQLWACKALSALSANSPNLGLKITAAGGIDCVIHTIRTHYENTQIIAQAGSLLANLATTPECIDQILASGGGACLIDAMHRHAHVREVQIVACQALYNLSSNPDHAVQIAAAGCIERIIKAILTHDRDPQILNEACRALVNLSGTADSAAKVVAEGGIECIAGAMRQFPEYLELQVLACWCLRNLTITSYNRDYRVKTVAAGGIKYLVVAMATHKTSILVQQCACQTLYQLAVGGENQRKILEAGCVERIIAALKRHHADAGVRLWGGRALALLVIRDDKDLKVMITSIGGIECIIYAMQGHIADAEMQREAVQALAILAHNSENGRRIAAAGGIDAIADAMRNHKGRWEQFVACRAFFTLCRLGVITAKAGPQGLSSPQGSPGLSSPGTYPVELRKAHPAECARAPYAIYQVSVDGPAFQSGLVYPGDLLHKVNGVEVGELTVEQVAGLLKGKPGTAVCITLSRFCSSVQTAPPEIGGDIREVSINRSPAITEDETTGIGILFGRPEIVQSSAAAVIECILDAMNNHKEVKDTQRVACGVLAQLALEEESQVTIRLKGGIDSIVEAMRTHFAQSDVQEWACWALANLAFNAENQVLIAQKGGIEVVIATMKTHGQVISLLRYACRTLSLLADNDDNKVKIAKAGGTDTIVTVAHNHKEDKEIQRLADRALEQLPKL